jgi:hypothetical protein
MFGCWFPLMVSFFGWLATAWMTVSRLSTTQRPFLNAGYAARENGRLYSLSAK